MSLFIETIGNQIDSEDEKEISEEVKKIKEIISTELAPKTKNITLFGETNQDQLNWIRDEINKIMENHSSSSLSMLRKSEIITEMLHEITSLGKIHEIAIDPDVSEIMINAPEEVWIEKKQQLMKTDIQFKDEEEVYELARKIVSHANRSVNASTPTVDAHLPDGSRVHVIIPPLSPKGTTITIRKFFKEKITIKDLIKFGTINEVGASLLEKLVLARANIIVNGGTGSGKTTTLNVISNFIPHDERVITIEDSLELQLSAPHWVKLEAKPANNEGKGEVTIRDLVKQSLRMRPDRILVGEVRDGSALDLLDGMNTGHEGSAGTVHSNDPKSCKVRLGNLIRRAGLGLDKDSIERIIADGVDIIVQISKMPDHTRKITDIAQVYWKNEDVFIENIFEWQFRGENNGKLMGEFVYTGVPLSDKISKKLKIYGVDMSAILPQKEG